MSMSFLILEMFIIYENFINEMMMMMYLLFQAFSCLSKKDDGAIDYYKYKVKKLPWGKSSLDESLGISL